MPPLLDLPFNLTVDLSVWEVILNLPTLQLIQVIFAIAGWAVLALVIFWVGAHLWLELREDLYKHHWQWVVLAIDVPTDTVQSPKAVEQIFSQLSGAFADPNFGEKYWKGVKERWFSFEIISLEGYIQFLVYTEIKFRDLVEAAVYAQYPMAEITEVEDYVSLIPDKYPNETHDMFGVEFGLVAEDPYPIRSYSEFEHNISKDITFADPMAAVLENFTRIGAGENLWLQIIIEPVSGEWKKKGIGIVKGSLQHKGQELVKNIVENKKPHHEQLFFLKWINLGLDTIIHQIIPPHEDDHGAKKDEPKEGKVSDMTPGLKDTVKAIEDKISKVGFKTKIRAMYAANREVFNPSRCLDGLVGAFSQFNYPQRNGIIPKATTSAHYAFKKNKIAHLKKEFVKAYKKRKLKMGKNPYILNVEELATIWHFPLPLVKAPLVQKTGSKRAEPPINLPVEVFAESPLKKKVITPPEPEEEEKEEPPELMWG
jgi:hypothetical protein